jgi:hypothetical protein
MGSLAVPLLIPCCHVRVPLALYPSQLLVLTVFFIVALLIGIKWYVVVFLICISLVTSDNENLFMCLFAIYILSLVKCLVKYFCHSLLECLLLILSFESF